MNRDHKWGPWPDCALCADKGMHQHEGDWTFCKCPAGVKKQAEDPEAADRQNEVAAKLGIR